MSTKPDPQLIYRTHVFFFFFSDEIGQITSISAILFIFLFTSLNISQPDPLGLHLNIDVNEVMEIIWLQ